MPAHQYFFKLTVAADMIAMGMGICRDKLPARAQLIRQALQIQQAKAGIQQQRLPGSGVNEHGRPADFVDGP